MAEESGQERTEQATQRRRQETRRRGQVARSPEVNSAGMLLAGFSVLFVFGKYILGRLENIFNEICMMLPSFTLTPENFTVLFLNMLAKFFLTLLPVFVFMGIMAIIINILQVGFLFTGEPLTPKLEKINPAEGFKRLFSRRSAESLVRDIIKIIVVGWIGYSSVVSLLPRIVELTDYTVGQILSFAGSMVMSVALKILIGYIIIAILDYAFQRWDYERSMMMTRQEVREELKQTEGDPLLRARIRTMQREVARRRMMEEVPKAEVVITNPTEIAVAIAYEPGMAAPVVVAKGRRMIAERIRAIAEEHNVPIVENVLLAQALFKAVDTGRPIPPDLYTAVAEVLAYVYRLKGKNVV